MLRLLKEVFKSLSKNKIIMIGLSILIFLSSGVFTLVSNVRNNYVSEFTKYKDQSVLQDATVDLSVNFLGNAENNGFDLKNKDNPELRTYYLANQPTEIVRSLEIPKNVQYISLVTLGAEYQNAQNVYIKATDLNSEYLRNNSLIYNESKSTIFDLHNNTFKPNLSGGLNFELFTKSHSGAFVPLTNQVILSRDETITLDKHYTLSQIAKINRGERELRLQINDDYLSNFANLYVNAATKEATFEILKSKLWAEQGALVTISGNDVAKLLNFQESSQFIGRYYLNKEKAVDTPSQLFLTSLKTKENSNSIWSESLANKVVLNDKAVSLTRTLTNYGLVNSIARDVVQFYNFANQKTYKFNPNWSKQTEKTTSYVQNHYSLNYSEDKNNWTGVYRKYIENLKKFQKHEFDKFLNFSYWEKNIEYKDKNGQITTVKQSLTNDDFKVKIKLKNGRATTIQDVESISNQDIKESKALEIYGNANIKDNMFLKIKTAASEMAKTEIITEILKPNYGIDKIGVRQTITAKSINDLSGESQVYQFINAGNEKQQVLGQTQQVGKLYDENQQNLSESKLFIEGVEVELTYIESIYATKIIDSIFKGFVPDKNYLDANIRYVDFIAYTTKTKIPTFEKNQKIVVLSSLETGQNDYAIGQKNGKFIVLKRVSSHQRDDWEIERIEGHEDGFDYDQLHNWLVKNELTVDGETGESWLKQDETYKNIFFLPMEYFTPKAAILKQSQETQSLEIMFANISNFLVNSSLVSEGFLAEEDVIKLFQAFRVGLENNEFYKIFKEGKIIPEQIQKALFESFFVANERNGAQFMKSIIVKFIENFKNKIKYSDRGYTKLRSLEEQKEFLKKEANKLITFMGQILGVDLLQIVNETLSLSNLISYMKVPSDFLDSIVKLINSININGFVNKVHNWYQQNWNNLDRDQNYHSFSSAQIMVALLENIDETKFKLAFSHLIDNIDFQQMLDPSSKNSLYFSISKNTTPTLENELKNIFKKLNTKGNLVAYQNINNGLKEIVNIMDFKYFVSELNNQLNDFYFQSQKTNEEGAIVNAKFVTKTLQHRNIFATLIKSIANNNNFADIQNILIKMFNLSGKVSDLLILLAPAADPDKLDISSLAILGQLSTFKFNKMKSDFADIYEKLNNDEKFSLEDLAFIKKYLPMLNDDDLADREKLNQAFVSFQSLLQKLSAYAYLNNSSQDPSKWHLSYNINQGRKRTLGDFLVEFHNGYIGGSENSILNIAKKAASDQLGNISSPTTPQMEAISIFDIWFKFAAENPELSNQEIVAILTNLFNLTKSGNSIANLLNNHDLTTQLYADEILNNSSIEELKVTKSQVLLKEMTEQLWDVNINNSSNVSLKNSYLQSVFNRSPFNQKILQWMIDNKEAVTSYLGLLAAGNKNNNNFSTLTDNFLNLVFGANGFSKQEIAIVNNLAKQNQSSSQVLGFLGLPKVLLSNYLSASFPEVTLWTVTNPNNYASEGNGNLEFVIRNRIFNFSKLTQQQISEGLSSIIGDTMIMPNVAARDEKTLSFNLSWLNWIKENAFNNENGENIDFFGLNFESLVFGSLDSILEKNYQNRLLLINDNRSYSAKISQAFANKNGKEIYTGLTPKNSIEIERFLETIDEKYIINVGGVRFLIVGFDAVVDYIYPVIDEENLQVDVKNQALVFVNQQGFDRISNSFRGNAIKEYALVKMQNPKTVQNFVDKVNTYISNNFSSIAVQKAFLAEELDPINPERSLRVSIVGGILSAINSFNLWIIVILSLLVTLSVLFIIKRYISVRGKVLGILRAQGYSSFEIGASFTIFAFVSTGIGGTLGYGFGILTQQNLMDVFASYWTIPTPTTNFNWISFILTIFIPFLMMSAIIILTSLWVLRKKPIQLMSGIVDINVGNFARALAKPFAKAGIKSKFVVSLGINSFWKLIVLMISTVLTSFAMIFSISSTGILDKSVESTYQNRNYKYKMNLLTPTTEGGGFATYNKNELDNLLYTPLGQAAEAQSWSAKFFKPGWALINGDPKDEKYLNGKPIAGDPHIVTKSSVDIAINQGGLSISPWLTVLNSMPDSQKARTLKLSSKATKALEATQNLQTDASGFIYVGNDGEKLDFFKYDEKADKFVFMKWSPTADNYVEQEITTAHHRDSYRQFLVSAYKKLKSNDFFVSFGGVLFNNEKNEKYSHAQVVYNDSVITINGYKPNSQFVKITSGSTDFTNQMLNYNNDKNIYPLVINQVVAKKYKISVGTEMEFVITNHVNKNLDKIQKNDVIHQAKFEVIGINDTYINEEWTTMQKIVNKITGMDTLPEDRQFNGVLSQEEIPAQLLESVGIYAPGGYWAANDLLDVDANSPEENMQFFEQIFANGGILDQNGISLEQRRDFISSTANNLDLSQEAFSQEGYATTNAPLIREALSKYIAVYGANLYSPIAAQIISKDIEISFIANISQTINYISISLIVLFFLISMIILVMISTMMIAENEKNIAIFAILGYTSREKIILFFTIYVPVIVVATLLAAPLVIGFVAIFNSFLIASSSIAIPLVVTWWHVLISMSFTFVLFSLTSVLSWISLNKIKAVHLLKGK